MSSNEPIDALQRLEGFLAQDPGNNGLLMRAFEAALHSGRLERAGAHLEAGMALGKEPLAWRLHHAHWLMARREWQAAADSLDELLSTPDTPPGLADTVRHDLALTCLYRGRGQEGLACLSPLVDPTGAAPAPHLQVVWLRLMHRSNRLDEALDAARRWAAVQQLAPEAQGVAALVALDANDMALSDQWSRAALLHHPRQIEALVSRGSLCLAGQDPQEAKHCLAQALQANPDDGRALSAWAFALMLSGEWPGARESFERALKLMPEHIGTWHGLGWLTLLQGDLEAARSAFDHALAMDRNFAESHGGMAAVLARAGERAAAEGAIEIALRLDRHCLSAHYARAVLDGEAGDAGKLQQLAARLLTARRTSTAPR
ncbi:tetratricopeptide repeat protein [Ideonella sp. YS5]|uniref:tetratricopeptide repeat protein n=1 Tax=Ideonella sp. YS5 TaxID=3453714 RepID=UPI003EEFD8DB